MNDVSLIDVPHIDAVTALKNAGTRVELVSQLVMGVVMTFLM